jgi:signal transduction histidine kinase
MRVLALVKSAIGPTALPDAVDSGGLVLLVEDRTEQRALEARVTHQDRLASIGRLAAGVAHEIGNPLTGIASVAQNLQDETGDAETVNRLELILEQTRRIDRIVRTLVGFAHAGSGGGDVSPARRVPVRVADVVQEAFTLTRLGRSARAIEMAADVPADAHVLGDRQLLLQVLVNLCTNASDASPDGARVDVRAWQHERAPARGGRPRLRHAPCCAFTRDGTVLHDQGPGEGTGLGLSLVYTILTDHGGTLDVQSEEGVGTTVSVRLPLAVEVQV